MGQCRGNTHFKFLTAYSKLADINVDEYIDCDKDAITTKDRIQTISNQISQYESEDDIDEDLADIMSFSAISIASLKNLKNFLSGHENQEKFAKIGMH